MLKEEKIECTACKFVSEVKYKANNINNYNAENDKLIASVLCFIDTKTRYNDCQVVICPKCGTVKVNLSGMDWTNLDDENKFYPQ
jgi:hypothetical protein